MKDSIDNLRLLVNNTCKERNWNQFHSPKNIAIRLTLESAELLEIYNWKNDDQSYSLNIDELNKVKSEIGDILFNLINLCEKHNIDLLESCNLKIKDICNKYNIDKFNGSSKKYNEE